MRYFSTPGAGLAHREDPDWAPPVDWRTITEDEYNERKAVIEARIQLTLDGQREQVRLQREEDYIALLTLGLPESAARRLSEYEGGQ